MKKKITTLLLAFLSAGYVSAQADTTADGQLKLIEPPAPTAQQLYEGKSALALGFGAAGLDLEYAYNLHPNLNGRFRVNFLPYEYKDYKYDFSGNAVLIDAKMDFVNFDLLLEYLPFKKSSFKLIGGVSFLTNAKVDVLVNYDGTFTYGDIELSEEEIGDLNIGFDYSGVAPYLGLGFGRAVPKKRVGFGVEVGTYYAGGPDVSITATGALTPTAEANVEKLEQNMEGYAWLPYMKFRLAVRLN